MISRREFVGGCAALAAVSGCKSMFGAGAVRFGMITDLHYADLPMRRFGGGLDLYYSQSCDKLAEFVKTMNGLRPHFVIELGDFKDQSSDKQKTLACLERIEKTFAGFDGPRYHVLGNHDEDCLSKHEFLSRLSNGGKEADQYYAFDVRGIRFIVLDGCYNSKMEDYYPGNWDWTDANVPPVELQWLERKLKEAEGPAVVFCHQVLDDKPEGAHGLKNAAAVRAILERSGKVKSVFTGHQHGGGFRVVNGISYHTLKAAVCGDHAAGKNAYALVTVNADGTSSVQPFPPATKI